MIRLLTLATLIATAALAGTAAARAGDHQIALNSVDEATARTAVLQRSDFAYSAGATGGPSKPQLPLQPPCPDFPFAPKQSDLVVTGAAQAHFILPGVAFYSQVEVMKTPRMAVLGWQRYAVPRFVYCLRSSVQSSGIPVSIASLQLPRIGAFTAAYRALVDNGVGDRYIEDVVFVSDGRLRLSLDTFAALGSALQPHTTIAREEQQIGAAEIRLLHLMINRGVA